MSALVASRLELVTASSSPAISLAEAKAQCRVEASDADEESLIDIYRAAATELLNDRGYLGQSLGETQWRAYWDGPLTSETLLLPASPLAAADKVTKIEIDAGEGLVEQDAADFAIVPDKFAPTVAPLEGAVWPTNKSGQAAVVIEFTAGAATAPAPVKLACLVLVGFWFDNRDGGLTADVPPNIWKTVEALLVNERRF